MNDAEPNGEPRSYHHGDLRAALLRAAEEELAERGIDGLTLRGCARRAGVSHAAPAHHFAGVAGLLSELAATGFERLAAAIGARSAGLPPGSLDHIVASAAGYVDFARANPHLFRLMFRHDRLDHDNARAQAAAAAAFALPVQAVAAHTGLADPMAEPGAQRLVVALWSIAHGLADLAVNGQFDAQAGDDPDGWLHAQLRFMLGVQFGGDPWA
jgi:AcrR family transcriptional regulator